MGSGGGGSSSGKSDFPEYMKTFHGSLLDNGGLDTATISVMDAYNTATSGNSPFYNYITESETVAQGFFATSKTMADYSKIFVMLADFQTANFDTLTTGYEAGLIASVSTDLDEDININILPRYKANMRSIGAVMSSAYAVGEALIWDAKVKALAKTRLTIRELALKQTLGFIDFKKQIALATTDVAKTYYTLRNEQDTHYSQMNDADRKWDLELAQYCNNTLAAISGASLQVGAKKNQVGSAIGGALSGAAAGAVMGSVVPGIGTMVGAVAGGVMGLAGGLFS